MTILYVYTNIDIGQIMPSNSILTMTHNEPYLHFCKELYPSSIPFLQKLWAISGLLFQKLIYCGMLLN